MPLAQAVAPAVTGGVNLVVLREHDLPPAPRLSLARFVREGVGGRVPFLVTGSPDWIEKAGADGFHLEEGIAPVAKARAAIGPHRLLGVTLDPAAQPPEDLLQADYLLLPLNWQNPGTLLPRLRQWTERYPLPVIAGVDPPQELVSHCLEAGASGIALSGLVMRAYDRTAMVRTYARALDLA
jgi:thiamine-phosphate pyrophosphorylase